MPYLTHDTHRIAYDVQGEGIPIVFMHGWPTNRMLWHDLTQELGSSYRAITFDWLGFGESDKPQDYRFSFTNKMRELDAVIRETTAPDEPVVLVGHDIGGPPAVLWAEAHPERVRHLFLLNTMTSTLKSKLDRLSEIAFGIPLLNRLFLSDAGLWRILTTNTRKSGADIEQRIDRILAHTWDAPISYRRRMIYEPMHLGRRDELRRLTDIVRKLPMRKTAFIGEHDPLCLIHMNHLVEQDDTITAIGADNAGHFVPIDEPQAIALALRMRVG